MATEAEEEVRMQEGPQSNPRQGDQRGKERGRQPEDRGNTPSMLAPSCLSERTRGSYVFDPIRPPSESFNTDLHDPIVLVYLPTSNTSVPNSMQIHRKALNYKVQYM